MRSLALGVIVSVVAAYGVLAQDAGSARPATIRGQVLDAGSGAALRRARVTASAGDRQVAQVFTDDQGVFALPDAPAAALTVRAGKAGYTPAAIPVSAERPDTELRITLARSAAVMGEVRDIHGSPVFNTYVVAQLLLPGADRTPSPSGRFFTSTNRLGEYRLAGLPAGRYEITAVRIPPELMGAGMTVEERLFGPPESLEMATGAALVTLRSGEEVGGVDFRLPRSYELCASGPSVQPAEGAVAAAISGRVTSASGEPLACAVVRIVAPDVPVPQVYTDQDGRYVIDGLPSAGAFLVEARKAGYVTLQFGQRHPSDAEVPIVVRQGQRLTRADIVLPRESIVSGTVVDEHGEPIEGIQVWAFQLRWDEGRVLTMGGISRTDDRGQYRLVGVGRGNYVIAVLGGGPVGTAEDARGYSSIYYPGTPDASMAERIRVDVARDVHGVDIVFRPTPTVTVSGSVVDAAGRPFSGTVSLHISGRSGGISIDNRSAPTDRNGEFAIRGVPPGDYVLKAAGPPDSPPQFGMQYVTVIDTDPPPVKMTATVGATLEGRVVIDALSDVNLAGLAVSVSPADFDYAHVTALHPTMFARQDDGTFRVVGVTGPSRLLIAETPGCRECYLKSATVNGVDAADVPVDFGLRGGLYRDVEIVVSDAGAAIEGRVTDGRDTVSSYSAVVFSTSPHLWFPRSRHVRVMRSAADGSFRATGLPPGEYFVAALKGVDIGPFLVTSPDPELLDELSSRAMRVTVGERERRHVDLEIIRR